MYKEPLNWIMQEGWRRSPLVHSISVAHSWHTNHGVVVNDVSPVTPQATLPLAPTRRGSPLAPGGRGLRKALSARPRFLTVTSGGRGNPRESAVWRASPIRGDGAPHCPRFFKGSLGAVGERNDRSEKGGPTAHEEDQGGVDAMDPLQVVASGRHKERSVESLQVLKHKLPPLIEGEEGVESFFG
jgi:hypothetical protein